MNWLDWTIIILYLTGMISLSMYLGRSQSSQEDYFGGGRKLSWWSVGISTMATQTSAISFISIPAFVALKTGGGIFLYTAYYGTDQSQVQRELSAATTADTKKSLMWTSFPGLHWMWWNVFGFMIVALVSTGVSAVKPEGQTKNIDQYVLRGRTFFKDERRWLPAYTTLIAYFVLMLAVLILLSWR